MKKKRKIAAALALLLICGGQLRGERAFAEETYRNVKVLETEGEAYVERNEIQMPVYEQQMIQGGDYMTTGTDGRVDLRLDDDKYMVVEEDSQVEFELEGDQEKGAIRIYLTESAVYNEIENPLAQDDSYEIHTPDGVMAVRGTKFRVSVRKNSDGTFRETFITVFDGTVYVRVNNGEKEEAFVQAGEEAIIDKNLYEEEGNEKETEPRFRKRGGDIEIGNLPEYLIALAEASRNAAAAADGGAMAPSESAAARIPETAPADAQYTPETETPDAQQPPTETEAPDAQQPPTETETPDALKPSTEPETETQNTPELPTEAETADTQPTEPETQNTPELPTEAETADTQPPETETPNTPEPPTEPGTADTQPPETETPNTPEPPTEAETADTQPPETETPDTPQDTADPTPTDTPQDTADPTPTDTPQDTTDPAPTDTPQDTADPSPTDTPQDTTDPSPTDTPQDTSDPAAADAPQDTAAKAVGMALIPIAFCEIAVFVKKRKGKH